MSLMQSQQPVASVINPIGGQGGSSDTYRDRKVCNTYFDVPFNFNESN